MGSLYNVTIYIEGEKMGSSKSVGIRTYEVTEGTPPGVEDSNGKSY